MRWRGVQTVRDPSSRAPSAFISPCLPTVAARLPVEQAITESECCCADDDGVPAFDDLHSRVTDHAAFAYAFDLLLIDGDDIRRSPLAHASGATSK